MVPSTAPPIVSDTAPRNARTALSPYAMCLEASRRMRWDIERDVIRGRRFDTTRKFLPDSLTKVGEAPFLTPREQRLLSQIQARTYANLFGIIEHTMAAKTVELSQDHRFGNPFAFEALVGFTDGELRHQALFRRMEAIAAAGMARGYTFLAEPGAVARAVLGHSTWAVLALALDIEIFALAHYRASLEPERSVPAALDPLWADVLLFHWKEGSSHAILGELEWRREHARLDAAARDQGVTDLIALVGALDDLLVRQAAADAAHFMQCDIRPEHGFGADHAAAVRDLVLRAYRWQFVVCGMQEPRFAEVMKELVTPAQMRRFARALDPIVNHVMG
jgi:hypothetical protein